MTRPALLLFCYGLLLLIVALQRVSAAAPAPTLPTAEPSPIPTLLPSLLPSRLPTLLPTSNPTTPRPTSLPTDAYASQRSALSLLYKSTGKADWRKAENWMDESKHVSEWYGVTCSGRGSIISLSLNKNSLKGALPSELGAALVDAESIQIKTNTLSGSLPSQLGQLLSATSFDLSKNLAISSSIPSEFGKLSNALQYFGLYDNAITNSIPTELGLLTQATHMGIRSNNISSILPSEMGLLTGATNINVFDNYLTSSLPSQLGQLIALESILLNQNSFTSRVPSELGNLVNVERFELEGNSFSSAIPTQLGRLSDIEEFYVNDNALSSQLPTELGRFVKIEKFDLSSNIVSSTLPTELGLLSEVVEFALDSNKVFSSIPTQLGNASRIQTLLFATNQATGALPSEIGMWTSMTTLDMSKNKISGAIPSEVGRIGSALEIFSLGNNRLRSSLPQSICNLSKLVVVSLSENRLSGEIPACPSGFEQLKVFNVAHNRLNGDLPSVRRWPGINYVLLHDNQFSGNIGALEFNRSQHMDVKVEANDDILNAYGYYPINEYGRNLIGLTLHGNELGGSIPADFILPRSLKTFTIANNKLTGHLPSSMLELQHKGNKTSPLTILATNNRLSCDIPSSWNFTSSQQSLVLIGNAFSKPIPSWVNKFERKTSFLSEITRPVWTKEILLPKWVELLFMAGGVGIIATPLLLHYRRELGRTTGTRSEESSSSSSSSSSSQQSWRLSAIKLQKVVYHIHSPVGRALLACSYGVVALAASGLLSLALIWAGANYYECGDAFLKYSTASYLADAPTVEWLLAGFCTIWTAGLVFVLRRLFGGLSSISKKPGEATTTRALASSSSLNSGSSSVRQSRALHFFRRAQSALCLLVWLVILVVMGGFFTFLYVLTYSLPEHNTLHLRGWKVDALNHVLALYLSVVSAFVIPLITRPTARAIMRHGWNQGGRDSQADILKYQEVEVGLQIIARTLVMVLLPIACVLVLDNGCFSMWTTIWRPCRNSDYFYTPVNIAYTLYYDWTWDYKKNQIRSDYPVENVYGSIDLKLLSNNAVCEAPFQRGKCSRSILKILCPLFTTKMLYAILFAVLRPMIGGSQYRDPLGHATAIIAFHLKKLCSWCWKPCVASQSKEEGRVGEESDGEDQVKAAEPDPMPVLYWYELALIFGCLAPLLIVLLAVQLFVDATVFNLELRKAPSSIGQGQPLLILRRPLKCHLNLVLALQTSMVLFFFFDNDLAGRYLVAATLPLVLVVSITLDVLPSSRKKGHLSATSAAVLGSTMNPITTQQWVDDESDNNTTSGNDERRAANITAALSAPGSPTQEDEESSGQGQ